MDVFTVLFGTFSALYGVYCLLLYRKAPRLIRRIALLQNLCGRHAGSALFFTLFGVLPAILGLSCIALGLQGASLW